MTSYPFHGLRALNSFASEDYDTSGRLVNPASIAARDDYQSALEDFERDRDDYERAQSSKELAEEYFRKSYLSVTSELAAAQLLEKSFQMLNMMSSRGAEQFRLLLKAFVTTYNIRYDIKPDGALISTMSGMFAGMLSETKKIAAKNEHVGTLLAEVEEAFSDLMGGRTPSKIKSCIQKQFKFLEALGQTCSGVTQKSFGDICDELDWPHPAVRESFKKLYGFRSDYPGVGHGGSIKGMLRPLNMRDFVSLSLVLASITPYVADELNCDLCYGID